MIKLLVTVQILKVEFGAGLSRLSAALHPHHSLTHELALGLSITPIARGPFRGHLEGVLNGTEVIHPSRSPLLAD